VVSDVDIFVHSLAVDSALEAETTCRQEDVMLNDDLIKHLSSVFEEALKHLPRASSQ
jgi:hypothetical protein